MSYGKSSVLFGFNCSNSRIYISLLYDFIPIAKNRELNAINWQSFVLSDLSGMHYFIDDQVLTLLLTPYNGFNC